MRWSVRILEAQAPNGHTVFNVIATTSPADSEQNPDWLLGSYTNRLQALVAARRFAQPLRSSLPVVIPFPKARRSA